MSHLQMIFFYICCGIGLAVFVGLVGSLVRLKRFDIEILWMIIPFIILIVLLIPTIKVLL